MRRLKFRPDSVRQKPPVLFGSGLMFIPFASREQVITRPVSSTFFKGRKATISTARRWVYDDNVLQVVNKIKEFAFNKPHLVLKDAKGTPRFVLGYNLSPKGTLDVLAIQRLRTEYLPADSKRGEYWWSKKKETASANKLKEALGVHPSEYLFTEFLYRFRKQIASRKFKVQLKVLNEPDSIYGPIVSRFCKPNSVVPGVYELSFDKRRVRAALGLN